MRTISKILLCLAILTLSPIGAGAKDKPTRTPMLKPQLEERQPTPRPTDAI